MNHKSLLPEGTTHCNVASGTYYRIDNNFVKIWADGDWHYDESLVQVGNLITVQQLCEDRHLGYVSKVETGKGFVKVWNNGDGDYNIYSNPKYEHNPECVYYIDDRIDFIDFADGTPSMFMKVIDNKLHYFIAYDNGNYDIVLISTGRWQEWNGEFELDWYSVDSLGDRLTTNQSTDPWFATSIIPPIEYGSDKKLEEIDVIIDDEGGGEVIILTRDEDGVARSYYPKEDRVATALEIKLLSSNGYTYSLDPETRSFFFCNDGSIVQIPTIIESAKHRNKEMEIFHVKTL